jgi:hypothetical protein
MTDIVERLREYASDWRIRTGSVNVVEEAAAEITSLRTALATARKEADDRLEIFDRVVNNKATMWSEFGDRPKVTITFDEADEDWRFIKALADMRSALREGGHD